MKYKNIGGCVLPTQPDQQKRPRCKKCSTVLNNEKYLYIIYVLVCQNCTLIFSRTTKQNWIVICQCCLRIWRAGRGLQVLKCFVRGGQNFFLLALCVCVCVRGEGGFRFSTSPSVKKITDPSY